MRSRRERRQELIAKKRQADAIRKQHGLCRCDDEPRIYGSDAEAAADTSPPLKCDTCGRDRLRIQMIRTAGVNLLAGDAARALQ